jgi:hypothetical protein
LLSSHANPGANAGAPCAAGAAGATVMTVWRVKALTAPIAVAATMSASATTRETDCPRNAVLDSIASSPFGNRLAPRIVETKLSVDQGAS